MNTVIDGQDDALHVEPAARHRSATQVFACPEPICVGKAELWNGDAFEILDAFPSGSIDCVITSPPYNVGKQYERRVPLSDYIAWQELALEKLVHILERTGRSAGRLARMCRPVRSFRLTA